ncbi:HD domain-containing protein [Citricoccus sp. SGAir0253]|uniref:HD domain-containing protein n=1 Tax=Citricoccus sp. SGAir0253 TaxID=2567881 RepID=UPI0010CD1E34|nr:HD domain-containing protein [Citricoccus sp. SGAir0253]QCU77659.1 HD domain-containing protein [Citricoccus sp. SGAir0253]
MGQKTHATDNQLGRDVSAHLPHPGGLRGLPALDPGQRRIWALAAPHLRVRGNDRHSLYAFGIAAALLESHPEAEARVVLPAILLHDTGWSRVPGDEVLEAIAPGGGRPDLVLAHEREGARIAEGILGALGHDPGLTARVVEIIDGHDSRREALSIEDAIVKDADKVWRVSPSGLDTIMDWFGLDRADALRLAASRVHGHLFTDEAAAMALALTALESLGGSAEVRALD